MTGVLPHPLDPAAALSHPNQWCPFLARGWAGCDREVPPTEPLLTYDQRQDGVMTWATSDWWGGCYPGWRLHVQLAPRWSFVQLNGGGRQLAITGWFISVGGDDDEACCIDLPDHESARALLLRFPLVLTKKWLHEHGFSF